VENDTLVLSDLRMGNHPDYVFRHAVARRGNPHWEAIEPERLPSTIPTRQLKWIWQRIWNESSVR
jgi:inner membrane protein